MMNENILKVTLVVILCSLIFSFAEFILVPPVTLSAPGGYEISKGWVSVPPASVYKTYNITTEEGTICYKAEIQMYQLMTESNATYDIYAFIINLKRYMNPDNVSVLETLINATMDITPLDNGTNAPSVSLVSIAPKPANYQSHDLQTPSVAYKNYSISYKGVLYGFNLTTKESQNTYAFTQTNLGDHSALGMYSDSVWLLLLKVPDVTHDGNPYAERASIAAYMTLTFLIEGYVHSNTFLSTSLPIFGRFTINCTLYDLHNDLNDTQSMQ